MEQEEANMDCDGAESDPTVNYFRDRRPSMMKIQGMLRKVPKNKQHQLDAMKTSEGSLSSAATQEGMSDKDTLNSFSPGSPDEVRRDLARVNPFYQHYKESCNKKFPDEDPQMEKPGKTSFGQIFYPPFEVQHSLLESVPEKDSVFTKFPQLKNKSLQKLTPGNTSDIFQTSANPQYTTSNNTPLPRKSLNPFQSQDLVKIQNSDGAELTHASKEDDLIQNAKEQDAVQAVSTKEQDLLPSPPSDFLDSFHSFSNGRHLPSNVENDPFKSTHSTETDLFHTPALKKTNGFQGLADKGVSPPVTNSKENDLFHTPSGNITNLHSSQVPDATLSGLNTKDLFQPTFNIPGPFQSTPSNPSQVDSKLTVDYFKGLSLKTKDPFYPSPLTSSTDLFNTGFNQNLSDMTYPSVFLNSSSETESQISYVSVFEKSSDLFGETQTSSCIDQSNKLNDAVLTTPQGTHHNILQPTPFAQAKTLSASSTENIDGLEHVPFRRAPKPTPRKKPPRPPVPVKLQTGPKPLPSPEQALSMPSPKSAPKVPLKPVLHTKEIVQEGAPGNEDDQAVFEDVLLIGEEKCVEDWPEDSPELDPAFKPGGKLKLRRESLRIKVESDGGSSEDQDGHKKYSKKITRKLRLSLASTRGSKKFSHDERSKYLPRDPKLQPHDHEGSSTFPRTPMGEDYTHKGLHFPDTGEEEEPNGTDVKPKNPIKARVGQLIRKASTASSGHDGVGNELKHLNGTLPSGYKYDKAEKERALTDSPTSRRWCEGNYLEESLEEEDDQPDGLRGKGKKKKRLSVKFVPRRGFAINMEKENHLDSRMQGSAHQKTFKDGDFDDEGGATGYSPYSTSERNTGKLKMSSGHQRSKVEDKKCGEMADHLSDEETGDEIEDGMENYRLGMFPQDNIHQRQEDLSATDEAYEDEPSKMADLKPKKTKKRGFKLKKHSKKSTSVVMAPGATSSDYFLSEAAEAEWLAAQKDGHLADGQEDGEDEGDTDSLMEWWNTVEQWDEVPSDEENQLMQKDATKSFITIADKVYQGLRVFNKVYTERAEDLWQYIIKLHALADDISNFHKKAKIANITGGTTTAVGGVAAITGLALIPFTFGASLLITAIGVGVATAGGITSASATISDNVNNMHDRKKVEMVLDDYQIHLNDIGRILHFINQGLYKLRGHPLLRAGTQHYSEDWEIRRAVQIISLVDRPVMRGVEITNESLISVQGLFKGMAQYFVKDTRELKKGCKQEVVHEIKQVANILNNTLVELNAIREELQDAHGGNS